MKKWIEIKVTDGNRIYNLRTLEKEDFIGLINRGKLPLSIVPNNILQEELHFTPLQMEIINIIRENPGMTQTKIAKRLGTSRQRINYNVERLKNLRKVRVEEDGRETHCYP